MVKFQIHQYNYKFTGAQQPVQKPPNCTLTEGANAHTVNTQTIYPYEYY